MKLEDLTPKQRLKAEKWLAIIRECINSDLSNEEWCEQNNVSIKSYYYYLAKLRKMAIEQIPYKKMSIPLSEVHAICYRSPHNPLKKSIFFKS